MTVKVYTADGDASGEIDLPAVFDEPIRTDLIHKAATVARANRRQPYGADPQAGKRHAVESHGPGHGRSRVPRLTRGQEAAHAPGTRGGFKAHPPKAEKDLSEKINKKERRKAIRAALAAASDPDIVRERGHRIPDDTAVPIVAEDAFLDVRRTQDLLGWFERVGLDEEIQRADRRKIRAGKGTMRGRKYRVPRSALIVTHEEGSVWDAAANIPGVETTLVDHLSALDLAPGGDPGRLLVFTESALEGLA